MKLKSMMALIDGLKSRGPAIKAETRTAAVQSGDKDQTEKLRCGARLYAVQDSIERRIMDDARADSEKIV